MASRCILLVPGYKSRSPVAAASSVVARENTSHGDVATRSGDCRTDTESSSGAVNGGDKADSEVRGLSDAELVGGNKSCAEEKSV